LALGLIAIDEIGLVTTIQPRNNELAQMSRPPAEQIKSSPEARCSRSEENPHGAAGGSATAGGMNFQANVSAIAIVSMVRGFPLGWLDGLVRDVPVQVLAETGGSGDDLQIRFREGTLAEAQIKRGLSVGPRLWDPLLSLSIAIGKRKIDYGLLIISPDSSRSIQRDLARDIKRLGDGRSDRLSGLAQRFLAQLTAAGLPVAAVCGRLRIVTVSALDTDRASVQAARAELAQLCKRNDQIDDAWNRLYRDATELIELRGARTASTAIRVLRSAAIEISDGTPDSPGTLLTKVNDWVFVSNATFSIFGVSQAASIDKAWIPLTAAVRDDARIEATDLAEHGV
jgi:hypothetical protein